MFTVHVRLISKGTFSVFNAKCYSCTQHDLNSKLTDQCLAYIKAFNVVFLSYLIRLIGVKFPPLQVYYFRQGHELYVNAVVEGEVFDINPKKQCFMKYQLKVNEL